MKNSTWYKSFARIFHICLRFTKIRFFSQIPNFVTETNPDATNPIYSLSHFLSQQYIHFPNFPRIEGSFHNNNPLTTFLSILIIFAPSKKKKRETPSKNKSTKVFLKQVQLITAYSRPTNEIPHPVKKPQFAREHSISGHLSAKLRCRFYAVSNCEGGGVGV